MENLDDLYANREEIELEELRFARFENAPNDFGHGTQDYVGSRVYVLMPNRITEDDVVETVKMFGTIVNPEGKFIAEGSVEVKWDKI